ncbi:MAG: class I SAM-dependent methyltransferase, partial [Candidatus Aminicenantes bacterium]|nr:class I SAM-dependent methyltransferase [Candidatus Aminicenantes bacterium]
MLKEFLSLYRFRRRHNDDIARMYLHYYQLFIKRISKYKGTELSGLNILVIGSGKNFPFSYLMSMDGCNMTALDPQYVSRSFFKYPGILWHNGFRVAIKTLFKDIFFIRSERRILDPERKGPGRIKFIRANAENIPFPDDSFDIVFSYCAFEHINDIESVLDECSRVIKTDGLIYITIHSFPSLSGGHHPFWFFPDIFAPANIPPWYQLRGGVESHSRIMDY